MIEARGLVKALPGDWYADVVRLNSTARAVLFSPRDA
jgi:hypothetical protein